MRSRQTFIIKNQFETDDTDPCYHALLMWDMDVKHRINSKCNPHGPDWFAGGSDEIGLVTGLFLSEWNAYHPKEEQVRVLQEYCHDFIEQAPDRAAWMACASYGSVVCYGLSHGAVGAQMMSGEHSIMCM